MPVKPQTNCWTSLQLTLIAQRGHICEGESVQLRRVRGHDLLQRRVLEGGLGQARTPVSPSWSPSSLGKAEAGSIEEYQDERFHLQSDKQGDS